MPKKLFLVDVQTQMAVYADDEDDAARVAERHAGELETSDMEFWPEEVKKIEHVDALMADSLVWGVEGDKTVRELFAELNVTTTEEKK